MEDTKEAGLRLNWQWGPVTPCVPMGLTMGTVNRTNVVLVGYHGLEAHLGGSVLQVKWSGRQGDFGIHVLACVL